MIPYSREAYQLLHDGCVALAEVEENGIRVDVPYLRKAIKKTHKKIARLQKKIARSNVIEVWRKTYRKKTNYNSGEQLGHVLFDVMGFPSPGLTETGKHRTSEAALATVDHPFIRQHLLIKKLQKAVGTYLEGILRETVDGFLHPFFNLHLVRTYRSSSDHPNFQNIPVRDAKIGKLVRRAIVPREERMLVEIDYSGIEVAIAACYHEDPSMMTYLNDPSKDMHRDSACEVYLLPPSEVTKKIRYHGKNQFVFPQFYGDWYISCARYLWEASETLTTESGENVRDHLFREGIRELGELDPKEKPKRGSFEEHVQRVEKRFWNERFPIYSKWKKQWYRDYQERGWFKTKTGFICQGFLKRNEVINYPVQGSAFHCLLRSLIDMTKEIRKKKMETLIVGQIHDSIVADVPIIELEDYLALAERVMVKRLKRKWPWIIAPLAIEAEGSATSWAEKEEICVG